MEFGSSQLHLFPMLTVYSVTFQQTAAVPAKVRWGGEGTPLLDLGKKKEKKNSIYLFFKNKNKIEQGQNHLNNYLFFHAARLTSANVVIPLPKGKPWLLNWGYNPWDFFIL